MGYPRGGGRASWDRVFAFFYAWDPFLTPHLDGDALQAPTVPLQDFGSVAVRL
jgi:hypothetical protein